MTAQLFRGVCTREADTKGNQTRAKRRGSCEAINVSFNVIYLTAEYQREQKCNRQLGVTEKYDVQ